MSSHNICFYGEIRKMVSVLFGNATSQQVLLPYFSTRTYIVGGCSLCPPTYGEGDILILVWIPLAWTSASA